MITPQMFFLVAGIVLCVASGALAVAAVVYYIRNDIRGVRADLAGETRGTGQAGRRSATPKASNARRTPRKRAQRANDSDEEILHNAPEFMSQPMEDDLDTVLDTKLRRIDAGGPEFSYGSKDVNDDIPTLVTSMGVYHRSGASEANMNDEDAPTIVDGSEEDAPTAVEETSADAEPSFVVIKSILAINSSEIITAE